MARPSDKYGSPLKYNPDFHGPKKRRSCTDVLCLLLFIIFLGVWVCIASFAIKEGNIKRLTMPVDSFGHRCGEKNLINETNLFLFDLSTCLTPGALWSGCKTSQVCVKDCPSEFWSAEVYYPQQPTKFNITDVQAHLICYKQSVVNTINDSYKLQSLVEEKACAKVYFPSKPVCHRCIPILNNDTKTALENRANKFSVGTRISFDELQQSTDIFQALDKVNQVIQEVLTDLQYSWLYIVILTFMAMILSLFYVALLRYLAGPIIWCSILALILLFCSGVYFSYENFSLLKNNPKYRIVPDGNTLESKVTKVLNMKEFWLALFIVCSIALFLILFIVIFLRSRIFIATSLIKEGSKAVGCTTTTMFFPIIPWILQLGVILWSGGVFLFLYSSGSDDYRIEGLDDCTCTGPYKGITVNTSCTVEEFNTYCHQTGSESDHCYTAGCSIDGVNTTSLISGFQLYNLFGFFWGIWFITGLSQMILAGVFATWYWTFNKRNVAFFALTRSILRTIWYHMGTVAFGSLLIAICSFIRAMIEYVERKLKRYDNPLTKAIFCCCKCFFWCLEKFLCFINRNAYIMCAIHGNNFCVSAKDAFQLLMRNLIRVVFVDKVTDFLFFLGKLLVTSLMVSVSYQVFTRELRLLDDTGRDVVLSYPWIPIGIIGALTYIIAKMFLSVYAIAVDTLFLCFLEDCERNDGSSEKPYFMSKELMSILGKKNKKVQD